MRIGAKCSTPGLRGGLGLGALAALANPGLPQEVLFHIDGLNANERTEVVAGVGDVDGDGTPDLLIGSRDLEAVRVYSGRDQALLLEIAAPVSNTDFGYALDGAGDFDGDGVLDLLVGAPLRYNTGAAYVFSGRDGAQLCELHGSQGSAWFGTWVAGLGDVNQDGFTDVGAAGRYQKVRIFRGPDGHEIREHVGEFTRPSIAGVGDVDGDGHPDYAIGWPQAQAPIPSGLWAGRVSVFSGRDGAELHRVYGETGNGAGGIFGDHLGLSVAGAGDVNADGVPDFVAGGPGAIDLGGFPSQGIVRVYSGVDAAVLHTWRALEICGSGDVHFGQGVSGGGDLNGDGHDDVLALAATEGVTTAGAVNVFSGATGQLLWKTFAPSNSFRLYHCDVVGHLDLDGHADFALGNPEAGFPLPDSGRVTVFAGAPGDAERYCVGAPNSVGPGAVLELGGPISVGNDALRLLISSAVPGQAGFWFYGPYSQQVPFAMGWLCIQAPHFRLGPPQLVQPDGTDERELDFGVPPLGLGPGQVLPGSSWCFQYAYRDPVSGPDFNLSDALRVLFTP